MKRPNSNAWSAKNTRPVGSGRSHTVRTYPNCWSRPIGSVCVITCFWRFVKWRRTIRECISVLCLMTLGRHINCSHWMLKVISVIIMLVNTYFVELRLLMQTLPICFFFFLKIQEFLRWPFYRILIGLKLRHLLRNKRYDLFAYRYICLAIPICRPGGIFVL